MEIIFRIFKITLFALLFCFPQVLKAINPLYQLEVRNIQLVDSRDGLHEILFDITILHTNVLASGPFEFSSGQYFLNFNSGISNGILNYSIVPYSTEFTNTNAIPINPTIVGGQLRLEINPPLGSGNGPIVSANFPGTRIVQMSLTSTHPFNHQALHLAWRDSTFGAPYTQLAAYIDGVSTDVTSNGTLIVDPFDPLPVELSSFTALVNRNNVTLNWSTSSETNNSGFDIERLNLENQISNNWMKVGFVQGNGSSGEVQNYSFTERLNTGKYKYRLKQIDFNGNYEYHYLSGEINVDVPKSYNLSQNYPNPFNPSTKIDFDLSFDGRVSIVLRDISGREVASLVNEVKKAGYHTVQFDGSWLASGIYFYSITAENANNGFSMTKKMILLK